MVTVEQLAAKVEQLERELIRTKDIHEIQNLMARYMYLHNAGKNEAASKCFSTREDTTIEFHSCGLLKKEGMMKMYSPENMGMMKLPPDTLPMMIEHTLTTPCIEVAEDGNTAKALWISPGHETKFGKAEWAWFKYGVDFIKEDSEWKIWHYQVFQTFVCPFDTPWTDPAAWYDRPSVPFADGPTTYHNPYRVEYKSLNWPAPPEPYDTFENTWSMTGAPPKNFDL